MGDTIPLSFDSELGESGETGLGSKHTCICFPLLLTMGVIQSAAFSSHCLDFPDRMDYKLEL